MGPDTPRDTWAELVRTAALVRVSPDAEETVARKQAPGWVRALIGGALVLGAAGLAVNHTLGTAIAVHADGSADATLFSLTNQDRASNGVHALSASGALQGIGENWRWTGCGRTVYGRSQDMIADDYFSHQIPPCNQYVFSMMQAYGINYKLAGENIGWVAGAGGATSSADYINGQFMNSPEHRANILDSRYTHLGVGSWATATGTTWHYPGSASYSNVWMYSEEFAQLGSAPPPKATATPIPAPRNSPAPATPAAPPVVTTPAPTPVPTPTPVPARFLPTSAAPPPITTYEGLLPNSILSVLEAYLVD
jgi:uncharacterized protein YkwD